MARTAGTIEPRGADRWRVRIFVGCDSAGRRRYISKTVEGGRKDAERVLRKLVEDRDRGALGVRHSHQTLAAFLEEWLAVAVHGRVRAVTEEFYRRLVRLYIDPDLGGVRLDKLRPLAVQRWATALHDRGLSTRTQRAAFTALRTAMRQARKWRLVISDPTDDVDLPKARRRREMRALLPREAAALVAACEGERLEAFFLVALASGCRPGELGGLRWSDIELAAGVLTVRRAMTRLATGEVEYGEPKTDRGRRAIPLPAGAVEALRAHRVRQLEERMRAGRAWADPELVFTDTGGGPLNLKNLRHRDLKRIARRAFMPEEHIAGCAVCTPALWLSGELCEAGRALRAEADKVTLYQMRHSAASLLIGGGVNVKAVSERLGHASTAFTMDTYVHSLPTAQEHAAEALQGVLFGVKGGGK